MNDKEIVKAIRAWRKDDKQGYNDLMDLICTIERELNKRRAEFPTIPATSEVTR